MNLHKINWRELWPLIGGVLSAASTWVVCELGSIAAILLGAEDQHRLFMAGATLGVLAGIATCYFTFVRPLQKQISHYSRLLDELCNTCDGYERLVDKMRRTRRIEGDEWKDG